MVQADAVTGQRAHPTVAVLVDVVVAAVVVAVAYWLRDDVGAAPVVIYAAAFVAAAARRWTAAALAGIWLVAVLQVYLDGPAVTTTLAVAIVSFRVARHGRRATIWLAGLSIPAGAVTALLLANERPNSVREIARLVDSGTGYGVGVLGGFLLIAAVLGAPFAAGLVLRVNERYRHSRVERDLAESRAAAEREIAHSRAAQTLLTRDVHDVVGHSLAVIIAQADAAQAGAQDESVRTALAQISDVGRSSLAEIRDVLTRTREAPSASPGERDELAELVAGVRTAGNPVDETVTGEPRPLAPTTATAAYRVLQELLTNALKHGAPGPPIAVVRTWTPDGLALIVENAVIATGLAEEGMGLTGVRERLAAVDGTFRTTVTGEGRFVASAFLPVMR